MTTVILVLTAGFGDGHNTAAASVAEALRRSLPGEQVLVSDLVSEVQPRTAAVLKSLYQVAITHLPWAWSALYRMLAKSDLDPKQNAWMRPLLTGLRKQIEDLKPRVIVSTYPLYAGLLATLRQQMETPPLVTVITDSTTVHPIWLMAPSDLYCVSDVETDEVILKMGVPPAKTRITGFPVSLQFTETLPEEMLSRRGQRILYLPSTPARHVDATLEALNGPALACWYAESTLYTPVFIAQLAGHPPQRDASLQALADWAISADGSIDKSAAGNSQTPADDVMVWRGANDGAMLGARSKILMYR